MAESVLAQVFILVVVSALVFVVVPASVLVFIFMILAPDTVSSSKNTQASSTTINMDICIRINISISDNLIIVKIFV